MIYQNFKSSRLVNYKPNTESDRIMHSSIETHINVGLGLYVHQKTQSNFLYDLNLSRILEGSPVIFAIYKLIGRMVRTSYLPLPQQFISNMAQQFLKCRA